MGFSIASLQWGLMAAFAVTILTPVLATTGLPIANGTWTVNVLGNGNDTSFNPYIYRDGGGGISMNGYNLMVFSDTAVDCEGYNEGFCGFLSNTAIYFGRPDAKNPLSWTEFGTPPKPRQVVPFANNETTNSTQRTLIWPDTSYVPLNSTHALGFVSIGRILNGTTELTDGRYLYNSLVYLSLNDSGPTFTRIKDQYYYGNEALYGTFSTAREGDYLYLFAYNTYGAKLASVPVSQVEDRGSVSYFDGSDFTSNMPDSEDAATNVWNYTTTAIDGRQVGPLHGDCFFDNYHQSPMCIFTDGGVSGIFYATWSTNGSWQGPWSEAVEIFEPPHPPDPATFTYAGHAYPGWDPSGKTLLLSYSWGGQLTQMASITWDAQKESDTGAASLGYSARSVWGVASVAISLHLISIFKG